MFGQTFMSFAALMVSFGTGCVYATISPEERASMKNAVRPHVLACIEENGISKEDFLEKEKKGNIGDTEPCFTSCFFKKTEIFTNEGMYDVEKAKALVRPFIKDEEALANIDKIREECATVNDEEVSDGDKGCERAQMLFRCFKDHKDQVMRHDDIDLFNDDQ